MKRILFISIILIAFACRHSHKSSLSLIIFNDSNLNLSDLQNIDCQREIHLNNKEPRIKRIQQADLAFPTRFIKLTVKDTLDSIWYNMEYYEVNNTDTLRKANFGGRKIERKNALQMIRKSLCKFSNK